MWGPLIHSKIQYVSQIFSQESQTTADYENMNLVRKGKATKILKKQRFLHDGKCHGLFYKENSK